MFILYFYFYLGMKRSHHCNQLRKENAGSPATLIGWIDSLRDHGGVFFLDLRDREGKTQVVLDPENQTLSELFPRLKPESVIEVSPSTRPRKASHIAQTTAPAPPAAAS